MKKYIFSLLAPLFLTFSMVVQADQAINVNKASIEELQILSGVGERTAKEIVRHREDHGNFESMEDLDKVKFVGESLLEKNKDKIRFK